MNKMNNYDEMVAMVLKMQTTRNIDTMLLMDAPKKRHMQFKHDPYDHILCELYTNPKFLSIMTKFQQQQRILDQEFEIPVAPVSGWYSWWKWW